MTGWEPSPTADWVDEAIAVWDNDPEAWKEPLSAPPTQRSLSEQFRDLYMDRSVLEAFLPPLSQATEEFFDHVKALWVQMVRDRAPLLPSTADTAEFAALSLDEKIRTTDRMDRLMEKVFDYLMDEGRPPVPGWTQWHSILPENAWDRADQLRS
jgi:hypothetical protein